VFGAMAIDLTQVAHVDTEPGAGFKVTMSVPLETA